MNSYQVALLREMLADLFRFHRDNWDEADLGPEPARTWSDVFYPVLNPLWHYRELKGINYLYDLLSDEESKRLLVKILAYRYMGHRKVKLPRNNPQWHANRETMAGLDIIGEPLQIEFMNLQLNQLDLSDIGYNFGAYCTIGGGSNIFLQRQYELNRGYATCKAERGNLVIDAGACWGDSTLQFAHSVGEKGLVFAFEFIPANVEVLRRNLEVNSPLAERTIVIEKPIWNTEGLELFYVDWGPGSRVSVDKLGDDFPDDKCWVTTIDAVVDQYELPTVDFIKMNIQGAETSALEGARNTITRFHPKLAINLNHHIDDFKTIPALIESAGMKYQYYLEHHTIYENETVLFAVPAR